MTQSPELISARNTIKTESEGLRALAESLDNGLAEPFRDAVSRLTSITGRVIVTGIGKSGHIGSKIAATFASTGTPAFFVHPAEANHGDLGMVARDDAIIAMSWSGEAAELKGILAYSRRFSIPLIALTANLDSTLARQSDICLQLPRYEEACPHNLAPTTSSIMMLALGDALAIALLEARGFSATDFKTYHPGGSLGASLTLIREVMHREKEVPLVAAGSPMGDAVIRISEKGFGCVGVVTDKGELVGVITDGDLRRNIHRDMLSLSVDEVMTHSPQTVGPDTLANKALAILNECAITSLLVTEGKKPVGIIHMHDLLRIGVA
ncbi:MAG: KpsF/GutQ family sugar-phosphate isomerase [Pseudomonadota bacterium]